jgi:mono/diheme cytochrome c family protein
MKSLALLFAALLTAGCGSQPKAPAATQPKPQTDPTAGVSFAEDVQPIFSQNCLPCHSGTPDAKSSYALASYKEAIGPGKDLLPNVVAGNADSSLLYQMVNVCKMPPAGPLGQDQVELVKKWIAEGAKDN